jgi:hypothetical protein
MAPQSGIPPSYPVPTEDECSQRLAEVHGRLSAAMDNANTFGAFVDPRLLVELRDVVGEVLELVGDRPGCRYACRDRGFHCPISEPLEREAARLQASGWIASWDAVKARIAHDTVCLCGSHMSYLALRPADGKGATAWALCGLCRHWKAL